MKFDTIVIGGGIAGFTAALRCLDAGLKTAVISHGQSASHFSSGSIDLMARTPNGEVVANPVNALSSFPQQYPDHPYAKLGAEPVLAALDWYGRVMAEAGIDLHHAPDGNNHYRITPLDTLKSTWMSQPFVYPLPMDLSSHRVKRIVMVAVEGFRDFQPEMAADNLRLIPEFGDVEIKTASVSINAFSSLKRNPCELRSIEISRILRDEIELNAFANKLSAVATPSDLVVIPAIMGNGDGLVLLRRLQQRTGLAFSEVPTMPPSLLGLRLDDAMSKMFIQKGGSLLKGDQVVGGEFELRDGQCVLTQIATKKMDDMPLKADHFVVASGSFFSQGLVASHNQIREPMFGFDICETGLRNEWHRHEFFAANSHPFLSMGVVTNHCLNPSLHSSTVSNVFCAGAMLAHYNPVFEGCGSGVAISTGFHAAESIIAQRASSTVCDMSDCEQPVSELPL